MMIPHERVAKELTARLRRKLGTKLHSLVLYGSVARKTATADSNIDLFLVIESNKLCEKVSDVSYDIDLENGVLTAIFCTTPGELDRYVERGSPFIENIAEEGIILYDDGTFKTVRDRLSKARRTVLTSG
ncbi:MAG: nucleotidyltransferase domain-containing protein [Chloroflexi bacterium]|nr:nucleotidyltransferase domain-containing protein [Chloroflexota bacterium]